MVLLIGLVFSAEETISKTIDIGNLIGEGLDITANGVEFIKKENENTLINFLEGGSASINGSLFMNVKESSSIELDNTGRIVFADLTATEKTIFTLGGTDYEIPKGGRIKYEEGKPAVFYGKAGDSLRFKNKLFDESGNDIGKFSNLKLNGESIKIERIGENSIIEGNFEIGNDKIKGFGGNAGKITLSKDGKISEIWKNTDATVGNMNHKVSGNNLKMYYDDNFNPLEHKNENYFNYGKGKISAGGTGFSSDLGKINNIFGDMNTTKFVQGIGTKERNLGFTLNGGNLEIDTKNPNLGFNIKSEGDFIINNGRTIIESQKISKIVDGKLTSLGKSYLFVTADYGEGESYGLSYSYDLNFNEGEYTLKDNVLTNKKGYVRFNANTEWEDYIRKIKESDVNEKAILKAKIDEEKGVDTRDYIYLLKDKEGLVKSFCEARDSANENVYGVKISLEELIARYMLEGGAYYKSGYPIYDYDKMGPNAPVWGSTIGLDNIGDSALLKKLKEDKFIPKDFQIGRPETMTNEQYQDTTSAHFSNIKDSLTAFAGELARRKSVFETDFKGTYGEEEFKRMSDDEKYFWLTYYFNSGEGAGKGQLIGTKYYTYSSSTGEKIVVQGKGREDFYKPWTGSEPGHVRSAHFNAVLSEATYKLMKKLGIFNYV